MTTEEEQDAADAEALFTTLEREVVPAYYERDAGGVPPRWVEMMRHSIAERDARFARKDLTSSLATVETGYKCNIYRSKLQNLLYFV